MSDAAPGWYPHPETGAWWWWDGSQWLTQAPEGAPPPPTPPAPFAASPAKSDYPVQLTIDYPDRKLSRVKTAFRLILSIPIWVLLVLLSGGTSNFHADGQTTVVSLGSTGILVLPPLLMVLFRRKYPRWWFDWNLELMRFSTRVGVYWLLMDDRYPSTDEEQSVHLDIAYPDAATDLNRWLPLVKWLLAIPHYFVLIVLYIGMFFTLIFAWFAIVFTARYPRGLFNYAEGVLRWQNRVYAYAFIMATDKYPPFRLST